MESRDRKNSGKGYIHEYMGYHFARNEKRANYRSTQLPAFFVAW